MGRTWGQGTGVDGGTRGDKRGQEETDKQGTWGKYAQGEHGSSYGSTCGK